MAVRAGSENHAGPTAPQFPEPPSDALPPCTCESRILNGFMLRPLGQDLDPHGTTTELVIRSQDILYCCPRTKHDIA